MEGGELHLGQEGLYLEPGFTVEFPEKGDYHRICNKAAEHVLRTMGDASPRSHFKVCHLLRRRGHCHKGNFI